MISLTCQLNYQSVSVNRQHRYYQSVNDQFLEYFSNISKISLCLETLIFSNNPVPQ
jgi:hypothetical protein